MDNYLKKLNELKNKVLNARMVRLFAIEKQYHLQGELYAKIEDKNLTGSIKDIPAIEMFIAAYKDHKINDKTIFIESTSGNMGISISYIAHYLGLKAIIVMPSSMSKQRRDLIKNVGGELLLIEGGMKECSLKVDELLKNDEHYLCLSQFNNLANPLSHFYITGPEIYQAIDNIDYIVAGIGTGGTISGIGKYFKKMNADTKIIGLEPSESPLLTKGFANKHKIQGIGANFVPKTFLKQYVDEIMTIDSDDAIKMREIIFHLENINVGISSGANLCGGIKILKEHPHSKVVVIFPDNGDRYDEIKD